MEGDDAWFRDDGMANGDSNRETLTWKAQGAQNRVGIWTIVAPMPTTQEESRSTILREACECRELEAAARTESALALLADDDDDEADDELFKEEEEAEEEEESGSKGWQPHSHKSASSSQKGLGKDTVLSIAREIKAEPQQRQYKNRSLHRTETNNTRTKKMMEPGGNEKKQGYWIQKEKEAQRSMKGEKKKPEEEEYATESNLTFDWWKKNWLRALRCAQRLQIEERAVDFQFEGSHRSMQTCFPPEHRQAER